MLDSIICGEACYCIDMYKTAQALYMYIQRWQYQLTASQVFA